MALLADRVQETSTTSGTGTLTLSGAVTGYVTFNSSFTNGDVVFYTIDDGLGNWEIGAGTIGTNTLARTTVIESSNSNALVPFSSGAKRVFCTAPSRTLLPDQTSNSGKILTTDGTTPSWATAASGTVTAVSVTSANGFAGTSSGGATPALTLSTSVTGVLKGNGTAISAATSGTDYAPATSGTSILKGSGAGGFSNATSGTDYAPATSGTSILKGSGSGGFSNATSGTDYAPATSGTSILYGNGSGGFSSVTVGTGLSFSTGTLANSGLTAYPGAGISVSTGSAWGTSLTAPTGAVVGTTDAQTLTNKVYTGLDETRTAPTISAGTLTLDCNVGNVFSVALNANITTLSFTNVPASGIAYALTLSLTADGTARTVTWGAAVKWPGGTAPTLTSTNTKVDTFILTTWDAGTTWFAFVAGQAS
jgi:hypothetical protein